jgi:hypothetical protein
VEITIRHVITFNQVTEAALGELLSSLKALKTQGDLLMSKIDDLTAAVAAEKTVEDSAVTLLQGLSAQLSAALASTTPDTAVQAVIDSINANATGLASAVTANTPTPAA